MKPTKLEWAVIAITAFALTAMACFFLGSRSTAKPVTITAQAASSPAVSALPSPQAAPSETLPEPSQVQFPIDLNTAGLEELMALPSIGEVRAQAILDYRAEHGPFAYVEDLRAVKGIGEGILSKIMDYVTVGTPTGGDADG